ncbi:Rab11 [Hexamita inflata]|uniref:Rab11 n=1 Tax=Hexamita inflata TaxID=28002 RepID=A0AA86QK22_9EUKA|nr:Rab11 [Hexamita inflata]
MLGSQNTGKTHFVNTFIKNDSVEYNTTIDIEPIVKNIKIEYQNKQYTIRLQIWDTNGQERFKCITSLYLKNASGVCLFCNENDQESFNKCSDYLKQVEEMCGPNTTVMLIGNQFSQEKVVQTDELIQFVEQHNILYSEINNKSTSKNGDEILQRIVTSILQYKLNDVL